MGEERGKNTKGKPNQDKNVHDVQSATILLDVVRQYLDSAFEFGQRGIFETALLPFLDKIIEGFSSSPGFVRVIGGCLVKFPSCIFIARPIRTFRTVRATNSECQRFRNELIYIKISST
jgi:hypothetical protein